MWNPSTCTCDCNKYCEVGQYLDYDNCVCRKKLIDYLIEECINIVDMETKKNNDDNDDNTNFYFILFIIFLVLYVLSIVGLIYYYRKDNNKKIFSRMYNIVYSCDNTY